MVDGRIIYGNTPEDSSQVHVDYLVEYTPNRTGIIELNSGWDYWEIEENQGLNSADYADARMSDSWRYLLPGLVEAALCKRFGRLA